MFILLVELQHKSQADLPGRVCSGHTTGIQKGCAEQKPPLPSGEGHHRFAQKHLLIH